MSTESIIAEPRVLSGDLVERPFLSITWQKGLPSEAGVNGCQAQDVVEVIAEKLRFYQAGALACEENEEALRGLQIALEALEARRRRRLEQGVLNTMDAHQTERTEDLEDDFSATGA